MKPLFLIMIFMLTMTMCHNRSNKKKANSETEISNQNDSILVTYYRGSVESTVSTRCERLAAIQEQHPKIDYSCPVAPLIIDTFIMNKNIMNKIEELLDNKTPAPDYSEDARMFIAIKKKNGHKDYICLNQRSNPVKYNGCSHLIDNEIIFMLRYYSGYYLWFKTSYYDCFEELQDTVLYQKVLQQKALSLQHSSLARWMVSETLAE
jgi:hypothetical protein